MGTSETRRPGWVRVEVLLAIFLFASILILVIVRLSTNQSEMRRGLLVAFQRFEVAFLETQLHLRELLSRPDMLSTLREVDQSTDRAAHELELLLRHPVLIRITEKHPEHEETVDALRAMWVDFRSQHIESIRLQIDRLSADTEFVQENRAVDLLSHRAATLLRGDFDPRENEIISRVARATAFVPRFGDQLSKLNSFLDEEIEFHIRRANLATLGGVVLIFLATGMVTTLMIHTTSQMNRRLGSEVEKRTRELVTAQSKLEKSRHMASMGRLAVGLAHHLNTPLGSIITTASYVRSMLDEVAHKKPGSDLADTTLLTNLRSANEIILASGRKGARVIDSFRLIRTASENEELGDVNISELIDEIKMLLEGRFATTQAHLDTSGAAGLNIRTKRSVILQVFTQLTVNALDYGMQGRPSGKISVSGETDGDHVVIFFGDDGPGLPKLQVASPFDPYPQLSAVDADAHGIGLFVAYSLVTQVLGGSISLESDQPGTFYRIELPIDSSTE
jgi:C4-dicarboxylate-specific signal transduction histidine kinase